MPDYIKQFIAGTFTLVIMVLSFTKIQAQDFEFGRLTSADSALKVYNADRAAKAVVLNEFGVLTFIKGPPHKIVHRIHKKIKLFKADAFSYGDIQVPYYKWDVSFAEKVTNFKAVVFTPAANGGFTKNECNLSTVHDVNQSAHYGLYSYAMPNLSEGCIIEYSYDIESPNVRDYRPWVFQTELPKMHSECWIHMPENYLYDVVLRGGQNLSKNSVDSTLCREHRIWRCKVQMYAMDSVKAFAPEHGMTDIVGYIPALYFNRIDLNHNYNEGIFTVKTWNNIDRELRINTDFGYQLKQENYIKRKLKDVIPPSANQLTTARAIYNYIVRHVKWNKEEEFHSTGIANAFEARKGTSGDINLMLITALNAYGIKTDPVILSTNKLYKIDRYQPKLTAFNYVIAQANIDNRYYYLDATDELQPFGVLPLRSVDTDGRVITKADSCYWVDIAPTVKNKTTQMVDLTLANDGKLAGKIVIHASGYAAVEKRRQIKNYNSVDEYCENVKDQYKNIRVKNIVVNGIDSIDAPLTINFDFEVQNAVKPGTSQLFFNPFIFDAVSKNPYNLVNRKYPVYYGPPSEQRLTLTLHLNNGYQVETAPQELRAELPDAGGHFSSTYSNFDNAAVFSHLIQINKSVYPPQGYNHLQQLYNKIIQAQKADIILKKKS